MRKRVLIGIISCVSFFGFSQGYKTAIGLKGGYPYYGSLDLKHDFGKAFGEFRLGGGSHDFFIQGLYEKNADLSDGVQWYWGAGGHLGFWNFALNNGYYHNGKYYDSGSYGGIDGVVGLEYTFADFPLNLAVDAGPTVQIFPYLRTTFSVAVAARFAIK
jgi:hypothetical protein